MATRDKAAEAERRLRFAVEFVKCGVAKDAARAVGVSETSASVTASKWMRRDDVLQEIERVRNAALARIELRNAAAVADLAEVLEHASAVLRLDATQALGDDGEVSMSKLRELPEMQRRALQVEVASTTDEKGQVFARHKIKRDPVALAAAKLLVDHYTALDAPKSPGINILNLNLPPEQTKAVARALLGQGAIDVTSKVVE